MHDSPPVKKVGCQESISCQPTLNEYILTRYAKILQDLFYNFSCFLRGTGLPQVTALFPISKMGEMSGTELQALLFRILILSDGSIRRTVLYIISGHGRKHRRRQVLRLRP